MDYAAISNRILEITDLDFEPVAVYLARLGGSHQAFDGWKHLKRHRYCQALMRARMGERVVLTRSELSCPAAASAFGFHQLPAQLANGSGLAGFGIVHESATGQAVFEGMTRLPPDSVEFIATCPLSQANGQPDLVVVEGSTEALMWLLLAEVNRTGGQRLSGSTAVLQATCVDATIIPHLQRRMNYSLGCYGCREATDLQPAEAVLGFPGANLPDVAWELGKLSEGAVPRSRAKAPYHQLRSTTKCWCDG